MHYCFSVLCSLRMSPQKVGKRTRGIEPDKDIWKINKPHVCVSRSYCKANTPTYVISLLCIDSCDSEKDRGIVHRK